MIKALYEMAFWLMVNRDTYIIFYVPKTIDIRQFKKYKLDVRCLNRCISASEIPEADLIISSNIKLLEELSQLNRGELLYLGNQNIKIKENNIKKFSINELGIGIPKRFFLPEEKRKKRVLIGGDQLSKNEIKKILLAIEKAAPSFYADDILIISSSKKIGIDTTLDYSFISENKIDFSDQFKNSFYLVWVAKSSFPIIPIWAMAAGVIVIAVNYSESTFKYPIEIKNLESMELALELMKTYKIGQYRNRLLISSNDISRNSKMEKVGAEWYSYLEKNLKGPQQKEGNTQPEIHNFMEEYLLDIIIDNHNSFEHLDDCITSIKECTKLAHRIIVIENDTNNSGTVNLEQNDDIFIIKKEENSSFAASCNKAILMGKGKYILLLKSTIRFNKDFIRPLVDMAKEDDVAVVSASLADVDGRIIDLGIVELQDYFKASSWESEIRGFEFTEQQELLGFNQTPYLIRRDLLPIVGLLDEGYLSCFEGIDYSLRAREKGYRVVYCPDSIVEMPQVEGATNKGLNTVPDKDHAYNISRKRFSSKWSALITGGEKRREPGKILVAGLVSWDYKLKRSQQLVRNLAKLGYQILYINPVCKKEDSFKQVEDNIYVYTPSGYGTVLYNLQVGRESEIGIAIADLLRELNFNNCITIINASYWVVILKYIEYSLLIYDCIDNYSEYENYAYYKDYMDENEEKILNLSDLVLVNSNGLYHEKKKINENTYILSNGFDKEQFSLTYQHTIPEDIPVGNVIVGYYGPIISFFDITLIKSAAEKYKGAKFVLVGRVDTDISALLDLNNIIFIGNKSDNHLAEYLYHFDLAIVPYKKNKPIDCLNSYNLYEYIAAGKRVLATNLPDAERFKGIIEIEDNPERFIDKMGQLLSQEDLQEDKIKRYNKIKEHNWYNRAKDLSQLIHLAYYDLYLSGVEDERDIDIEKIKNKDNSINGLKIDNLLKTSSIENFAENNEDIEVEVKEEKSIIKKIINFFNKT